MPTANYDQRHGTRYRSVLSATANHTIIYFTLLRGIILIIEIITEITSNRCFCISAVWITLSSAFFSFFFHRRWCNCCSTNLIFSLPFSENTTFLVRFAVFCRLNIFCVAKNCIATKLSKYQKANVFIVRNFSVTLDCDLFCATKQVSHVCFFCQGQSGCGQGRLHGIRTSVCSQISHFSKFPTLCTVGDDKLINIRQSISRVDYTFMLEWYSIVLIDIPLTIRDIIGERVDNSTWTRVKERIFCLFAFPRTIECEFFERNAIIIVLFYQYLFLSLRNSNLFVSLSISVARLV